jgi:acetoin utilization protein AcuB
MYRVMVEITGVRQGGARVSLAVEDKAGSIKDVADVIRSYGFRVQSILSTSEKAAPGQRFVVIRTRGQGDGQGLRLALEEKYRVFHLFGLDS